MNEQELAQNPRLNGHFVQDLNREPGLPLEDASFDAALICVSVQYLVSPEKVGRDCTTALITVHR